MGIEVGIMATSFVRLTTNQTFIEDSAIAVAPELEVPMRA
jgi:hypothetical protein